VLWPPTDGAISVGEPLMSKAALSTEFLKLSDRILKTLRKADNVFEIFQAGLKNPTPRLV
jgi:hypothetical protein